MRHALLFVAATFVFPLAASAQSGSLFGNSGRTGQSGSTNTSAMGGSSSLGSSQGGLSTTSSIGGSTNSLGGTGLGTAAGSGMGGGLSGGVTGTLGSTLNAQFGNASSGLGQQSQIIGRNVTNGLVGNVMAGQQTGISSFMQGFQGMQGFQNAGGRNANNRFGGQGAAEKLSIRPAMRIGFETPPTVSVISTPGFAARFSSIVERRPELRGVNIGSDESGRVVLRGTVASESARNLAAALVRLEPGVRDVVNELTIANTPTP